MPRRPARPPLETARLLLREMTTQDIDVIAAMLADPEVMRFWPRVYTRDEAMAWLRRQRERYRRDGFGYWIAIDKASGEAIGQVGLLMVDVAGKREAAIGYIIARPFWRRGYATEAAAACRDLALGPAGRERVVAMVRPENLPSQGVALKIGLRPGAVVAYEGFPHLIFSLERGGR